MHGAVTTHRHDVAGACASSALGELGAMSRTFRAREIDRPAVSSEGVNDRRLHGTAGAVPRYWIDDDVRVNQSASAAWQDRFSSAGRIR